MSISYTIDEDVSGPNALRIEHERDNVGACWYGNVGDLMDDAGSQGVLSAFGRGFSEKLPSAISLQSCSGRSRSVVGSCRELLPKSPCAVLMKSEKMRD